MGEPGYTIGDHPSDLVLLVRGRTLRELFSEAGRGLIEYTGPPECSGPLNRRPVGLTADDRGELLVLWLNEIIYLLETGFLPVRPLAIDRLTDHELKTALEGWRIDPLTSFTGPEVKAATYHQLSIRCPGKFWEARVILDL
jgi:SHS2 domain-containing protein